MVATPAALIALAVLGWIGPAAIAAPLRAGTVALWGAGTTSLGVPVVLWLVIAGVCSQGTGVFGGLLLLDANEATYCVPLNRASSILGGISASALLALGFAAAPPSGWELAGASLLVLAIVVLWAGPRKHPATRRDLRARADLPPGAVGDRLRRSVRTCVDRRRALIPDHRRCARGTGASPQARTTGSAPQRRS